jgi:hypothetical protein
VSFSNTTYFSTDVKGIEDNLNQAKADAMDSERCAIKTKTGTGTANEEDAKVVKSSSITRRVIIPRRSKRVLKGLCDQAMTNQDSSAAVRSKDMDNSTERRVTRKRNAEDSSFKSRKKSTRTGSFEGRCKQLVDFIDDFGHCNVPYKCSADPSLGSWYIKTRYNYNQIQKGQTPNGNLTQDQIERLEEISFRWKAKDAFEQRFHDLEAFKSEFGHCNVGCKYLADPSLGSWCIRIRYTYNHIQKGQTPKRTLTQDQIERLEEIGFKWKVKDTFVQRFRDLEAFKSEFGHCNVGCKYLADPSLGQW